MPRPDCLRESVELLTATNSGASQSRRPYAIASVDMAATIYVDRCACDIG
jgi:hypothetical protein